MNDSNFMTYPGGKNGSGVYQKIINQMPPHRMYVEAFLGGGAILRAKRPALVNVGIDLSKAVVREWNFVELRAGIPNLTVYWADAVVWLDEAQRDGKLGPDTLVYCDPPYLMSTRSSQRQLYAMEMQEEAQHRNLIGVLKGLGCMVMISGYWSELYAKLLGGWRTISFKAMTRSGKTATEWLWMNYPEPVELHDYRYLGETFRQREQLKRMKARWMARLEKMPVLKRQALLMAIRDLTPATEDGRIPFPEGKGSGSGSGGEGDVVQPSGTIWRNAAGEFELPLEEYLKQVNEDGKLWDDRDCVGQGRSEVDE